MNIKLHTTGLSLVSAALLAISANASATNVYGDDYESLEHVDIKQSTVCSVPQSNSNKLVWSEDYESFVSADIGRAQISRTSNNSAGDKLVFSSDYEDHVPANMARLTISSKSC